MHRRAERRREDEHRGSSSERGYDSRWQKARRTYLASHPLCVRCEGEGRVVAAKVVDHVVPHRGDWALFWDEDNWAALCETHHNAKTAREDGGWGNHRV